MQSKIHIALAGNPNSGKTTLFNALTGARQYVGNWPGVTVEKKEGRIVSGEQELIITDLPGTYSLSPYSLEEVIARDYIVDQTLDVVINIVDASNIERNLYLTLQLIELGTPVVVALNMMDIVQKKGTIIDVAGLSHQLGVPVIPIVASSKKGAEDVLDAAVKVAKGDVKVSPVKIDYGEDIEKKIVQITKELQNNQAAKEYNKRWLAIKVLEQDDIITKLLNIQADVQDEDIDLDIESMIADRRYQFIHEVVSRSIKKTKHEQESTSDKIDRVITNKWLGLPIFAGMMYLVFYFTFNIGNIFLDLIEGFFGETVGPVVGDALASIGAAQWLQSLVVDGIIAGVGAVLTFLPNIIFLFIAIALLEDSGYMARVAFIMDRAMRKIGLNGKAFIPMLMGFGCTVPAIMATRTMEEESDRLTTMMITPFMSCSARLPIYILFAGAFFPGSESAVVFSLYFLGILVAVLMGIIFRKTIFKGDGTPFVMELPPYRIPTMRGIGLSVWERVKAYITRAGTVIFSASIIMWLILGFNFSGVAELNQSIGASLGRMIAPIFKPLGFGNWQSALSLFSGLLAKEAVVSNMAIIFGLSEQVAEAAIEGNVSGFLPVLSTTFTGVTAYAFMVFSLLYTPCIAVIGVIKRETNSWRWTGFSVLYQFAIAWIFAFIIYWTGTVFGIVGGYMILVAIIVLLTIIFSRISIKERNVMNTAAEF